MVTRLPLPSVKTTNGSSEARSTRRTSSARFAIDTPSTSRTVSKSASSYPALTSLVRTREENDFVAGPGRLAPGLNGERGRGPFLGAVEQVLCEGQEAEPPEDEVVGVAVEESRDELALPPRPAELDLGVVNDAVPLVPDRHARAHRHQVGHQAEVGLLLLAQFDGPVVRHAPVRKSQQHVSGLEDSSGRRRIDSRQEDTRRPRRHAQARLERRVAESSRR
jgi:hypothetical protein